MEQWCNGCKGPNQSWLESYIVSVESLPIDAIIPIGRSGLVYIKWYQRPCCPLGILLFSLLDCYCFCLTYSPQKAKKIYTITYL